MNEELIAWLREFARRPFVGSYCDQDEDARTQFAREVLEKAGVPWE